MNTFENSQTTTSNTERVKRKDTLLEMLGADYGLLEKKLEGEYFLLTAPLSSVLVKSLENNTPKNENFGQQKNEVRPCCCIWLHECECCDGKKLNKIKQKQDISLLLAL